MKKIFLLILGIVFQIALFGQKSSTEQLIIKLSKEKFSYMNANDTEKLKPLLDDRMVFIHSNGLTETKTEMLQNLKNGKWGIKSVKVSGAEVRVFKNDVAILTGKGAFDVTTEGKPAELTLYYTEVWTHFKKGWVLVSRHANRM
jgi:hypothetical protein